MPDRESVLAASRRSSYTIHRLQSEGRAARFCTTLYFVASCDTCRIRCLDAECGNASLARAPRSLDGSDTCLISRP
jgi:hypothetical protein